MCVLHTFFLAAAFLLSGEALALAGATRALRAAPVPRRALPARADRSTALPWPLASLAQNSVLSEQMHCRSDKCFEKHASGLTPALPDVLRTDDEQHVQGSSNAAYSTHRVLQESRYPSPVHAATRSAA